MQCKVFLFLINMNDGVTVEKLYPSLQEDSWPVEIIFNEVDSFNNSVNNTI